MTPAAPAPAITVAGNVEGSIVIGDHNFVVNTNHGTIIYQQAGSQVKLRDAAPQPPRAPRRFVGRATELAALERAITGREAAAIVGAEGLGKSALLRRAAHLDAARGLPNGVLFLEGVDAAGRALGADDVLQQLFNALFESDPPLKVDLAAARTHLSNTRPLVLLDNLSLPAVFLTQLPDLFPNGALVWTSARPASADLTSVRLGPLPRADALELLTGGSGLEVTDDNRPGLEKVCELLGDGPLALSIAAVILREPMLYGPEALQRLAQIHTSHSDPVQAGLDRAYGLAYSVLSVEEKQLLAAAAAAPAASVDPDWLGAVMGGAAWTKAALERLNRLGLLTPNSPRLRLAPGLRERVISADEAAVRLELTHYLVERLSRRPYDFTYAADELGNGLGLIGWAREQGRHAEVIALTRAFDPYLTLAGLWEGWQVVLDATLQAARALNDSAGQAWALHQLGTRSLGLGERELALNALQSALTLRRELSDTTGAAYTQHNLNLLLPPPPPETPDEPPSAPRDPAPRIAAPRNPAPVSPLVLGASVVAVLAVLAVVAALLLNRPASAPPPATPLDAGVSSTPVNVAASTATAEPATPIPPTPILATSTSSAPTATLPPPTPTPWRFAFVSDRESGDIFNTQIYLINADGSGLQQVTQIGSLYLNIELSADGQTVAYTSPGDNGLEYFRVNLDGTGRTALPTPANPTRPSASPTPGPWPPDARVFPAPAGGAILLVIEGNVYLRPSGTTPQPSRLLIELSPFNCALPGPQIRWSPDGRQAAISGSDPATGNSEIYVANADGSGLTNITNHPAFDSFQGAFGGC